MTFSYSFNPKASDKDAVRFLLGDTQAADPFLQDEEIAAVLSDVGHDRYAAAVACCEAIISQLARKRDESVGDVSVSASQMVKNYQDTLLRLRNKQALAGEYVPYAGGISRADKSANEADADRVRPDFSREEANALGLGPCAADNRRLWATFGGAF